MLNLYSKKCRYAIRALMKIGAANHRDGFSLKTLSRKAGLPEPYTRKIFQVLVKGGLLAAKRGPGGGYRFAKDPSEISVLNLVHAIDGSDAFDHCVVKNRRCGKTDHCTLHRKWTRSKTQLIQALEESTVRELIGSEEPKKGRDNEKSDR